MTKGGKATAESKPKNVLSLSDSESPYKKSQEVRWACDLQATLRQPKNTAPA